MKTLKELMDQFRVRVGYSSFDSSIVYPWDGYHGKFTNVGEMDEDTVNMFLAQIIYLSGEQKVSPTIHIANKYAIPLFATEGIRTYTVFFAYQHDNTVYMLSQEFQSKR